jgi:SAM-dependent methyltransferase
MQAGVLTRQALLALFLSAAVVGAHAQTKPAAKEFEPVVGQEGKDVVWVPTSQALVDKMLDMANVTPSDFVIDLGSGDGRTVITAAKRGAKALGVEYNPNMVALSKRNAAKERVGDRAQFVHGDIFETDFSQATVITLFLLPDLNVKLRPKILDMKPGTRVVSNSFTMGEWSADETQTVTDKEGCTSYCTAYLWIVPANVEGKWKLPDGELTIKQTFQQISGTLARGGQVSQVTQGTLRGDQISFMAGGAKYAGTVEGTTINGVTKTANGSGNWTATRAR